VKQLFLLISFSIMGMSLVSGCGKEDCKPAPTGCDIFNDPDCAICKEKSLPPDLRVHLPADEGAHEEEIEWWYWTGHLQSRDGRWFGFQMTFFLSGTGGVWAQIGHHAVSDIGDGSFHFRSAIGAGRPDAMAGGYHFDVPGLLATGGADGDVLHGEVDNYITDLYLVPLKSAVYQHGVGYTDYSFGGYTYYVSRERLAVRGMLHNGAEALAVEGIAWFDHQWGSLSQATSMGWDWFALQLDDNREYMIFLMHDQSGMLLVGGSYTDAECNTVEVDPSEVEATSLGEWTSSDTGCTYPSGWNVKIQGKNYIVMPMLDDQELHGLPPFLNYWEGACAVSGDASGRAYVELTGYCP
jgi:predicted secreted hydrolase